MSRSPSKTRVCFISFTAYTYFADRPEISPGGAERQLYLLGQELKDEFDVHFIVGDYGQPKVERRDGVTLHRAYTPTREVAPIRRITYLARLFSAMRRADADVYVYRGDRIRAILTYAFTRALGERWVYNLAVDSQAESDHGFLPDPLRPVFRRVLGDADGVIAQTPYQKRQLSRSYSVESTVVPNGYPPLLDDASVDPAFFLYVGRIEREQKRPHRFLDLAERLPDESFVLVGAETDPAYHKEIAHRAENAANVTFPGKVDPDDIHEYYRRAIALVNTSSQEGFPNTFLEAWRCGTPVLSLDVDPGRFSEAGSVGYAGGDFEGLVQLTKRLAESPGFRDALGENCRDHFTNEFRISEVATEYGDVLRASVGPSNGRRGRTGSRSTPLTPEGE